jgi:hypothetical protein
MLSADETDRREIADSIGFESVFPYMGYALARFAQNTHGILAVTLRRITLRRM